jgi:hypothetical protein
MTASKVSWRARLFLALCTVLVLAVAVHAAVVTKTYYVSPTGRDASTCGSVKRPCKTVTYVLTKKVSSDSDYNIYVIHLLPGTYNENLVIDRRITLAGDSAAASTIAPATDTVDATIVVRDGARVKFNGLTIKAGRESGLAIHDSAVEVENATVEGIDANVSKIHIYGTVLQNSPGAGLNIGLSCFAGLDGCTVSNNAGPGVQASSNTSVNLLGVTLTNNNSALFGALGAVFVSDNSSARLQDCTVKDNQASGVSVQGTSSVTLGGGNKITNNGLAASLSSNFRSGLSAAFLSQVFFNPWPPDAPRDEITGNQGPGIWLTSKADLHVMAGLISGNQGDGVNMNANCTASFQAGVAITNNAGYGINCNGQDDSKYLGTPDLSGNTLGDKVCSSY